MVIVNPGPLLFGSFRFEFVQDFKSFERLASKEITSASMLSIAGMISVNSGNTCEWI